MTNACSFCSCLALYFSTCGPLVASPKILFHTVQRHLSLITDTMLFGLIHQSAFPAGLEPSGEMESWFRSLDNLPRSVGVFQQANSIPLPGMGSPRGSAGSDDWAIGAGQAGSSGSSSQPRGSSASKQGMKAAKGVGR